MAFLIITGETNGVNCVLNDYGQGHGVETFISKTAVKYIQLIDCEGNGRVIITFLDGDNFEVEAAFVDQIDGNTAITTNKILYDKLKALL